MLRDVLKEELQNTKRRILAYKKAIKELPKGSNPKRKNHKVSIQILKLEVKFLKRALQAKEFYQAKKLAEKIN